MIVWPYPYRRSSALTKLVSVGLQAVHRSAVRRIVCDPRDVEVAPASTREPKSSSTTEGKRSETHPMEVLSTVFRQSKSAVLLHRELILHLVSGNSAGAAAAAEALAKTVKHVRDKNAGTATPVEKAVYDPPGDGMSPSPSHKKNDHADAEERPESDGLIQNEEEKQWHSPEALRIIILETTFECADDEHKPNDSSTESNSESENLAILDRFLKEDGERWNTQKHCLANILLRVAQCVGLRPMDVYSFEDNTRPSEHFIPVRHANVVIRGEVPDTLQLQDPSKSQRVEEECMNKLRVLKQHMKDEGVVLTPLEERMALYEIRRAKTMMRYSVGIKRDLQRALDCSTTVKERMTQWGTLESSPSAFFVGEVIRVLNAFTGENSNNDGDECSRASHVTSLTSEEIGIIEKPVVPFTFMIKCCLWFDTD